MYCFCLLSCLFSSFSIYFAGSSIARKMDQDRMRSPTTSSMLVEPGTEIQMVTFHRWWF